MATVNFDLSKLEAALNQIVEALSDSNQSIRPIAIELSGLMQKRIHEDGVASDGTKIGTYTSPYLERRAKITGLSGNSVVLYLTGKMFSSWGAFGTERGWGVGFQDSSDGNNVSSGQKLKYAEEHFNKKIGDMTKEEAEYADIRLKEIADEIIKKYA